MTFNEIINVILKTVISYFFLLAILRVMGKREIGKVSTFDIVVFFVISELFSLSLNEPEMSILHSIIPITVIVILQLISAFLSLKSSKARKLLEGQTSYIIYNGEIQQDVMKKERYTIEDLMVQLRTKDIQTPDEVSFAILEDNGTLNVITKQDCNVVDPEPLISDGVVVKQTLNRLCRDENWLNEELEKKDIHSIKDVFLCIALKSDLLVVKK
ncbi:MAG: DUF421 domain-containing protein [Erysipelotrichales bacterium]|nr:DUF421 domain-containing protein [Erysipelotrichales bacterium]